MVLTEKELVSRDSISQIKDIGGCTGTPSIDITPMLTADKNLAVTWSVTPDCAFEDATYTVIENNDITNEIIPDTITDNYALFNNVIVNPVDDPISKTITVTAINGDSEKIAEGTVNHTFNPGEYCGNGRVESSEECDSGDNCYASGGSACTCEFGYIPDLDTNGCICSTEPLNITHIYPVKNASDVPINSKLIWSLNPNCQVSSPSALKVFIRNNNSGNAAYIEPTQLTELSLIDINNSGKVTIDYNDSVDWQVMKVTDSLPDNPRSFTVANTTCGDNNLNDIKEECEIVNGSPQFATAHQTSCYTEGYKYGEVGCTDCKVDLSGCSNTPAPVISNIQVACGTSCTPATGDSLVSFDVTNATTCDANVTLSGLGTITTPDYADIGLAGFTYNFDSNLSQGDVITITILCDGLGGSAVARKDVTIVF